MWEVFSSWVGFGVLHTKQSREKGQRHVPCTFAADCTYRDYFDEDSCPSQARPVTKKQRKYELLFATRSVA